MQEFLVVNSGQVLLLQRYHVLYIYIWLCLNIGCPRIHFFIIPFKMPVGEDITFPDKRIHRLMPCVLEQIADFYVRDGTSYSFDTRFFRKTCKATLIIVVSSAKVQHFFANLFSINASLFKAAAIASSPAHRIDAFRFHWSISATGWCAGMAYPFMKYYGQYIQYTVPGNLPCNSTFKNNALNMLK